LLFIAQFVDVEGATGFSPGLSLRNKVVEGGEPGVDRRLNVFEFGDFICEVLDVRLLGFVLVVEVVEY
jgi:hypothetical protein